MQVNRDGGDYGQNNKDKKYEQDLKKLDTEHTALQTEYDSIKEVLSKNVERSFKAFS